MAMRVEGSLAEAVVPITGRQLALPDGPIFHLQRAGAADYEIGEFRAWAGYKNLGADTATADLAHFQHVVSFADTQAAGRTGVHAHFAHAHIVIPTSGRGVFSYDGVVTAAEPGAVIVQHGGTVHDQFEYSYAAESDAANRRTPQGIEPPPAGAAPTSFGFLELFVPKRFANVEIVPPGEVTETDQRTAWDHPYHAAGGRYFLQAATAADAAYRPVAGRPDLEARDCGTWAPTGGLVATWVLRPAAGARGPAVILDVPGETGGVDILYMVGGSASIARADGETVRLQSGDTLTMSQGLAGDPFDCSADMRLVRFFIAARTQQLRERTAEEIAQLEALGPRIITRREVRPEGDARPVNGLHES
jgi:hypothetical protein